MDVTTARLLHHAAAPRPAGEEHPTYYVGRRSPGIGGMAANLSVQAVGRHAVRDLRHHRRWSMAAFDWGAETEGAVELAYALLEDLTGLYPSAGLCEQLATDVLARLPGDGFVVADMDLLGWLESRG
ncbi:MAG TPA: DUF6166 domain-containing protein [Solirubrobacteraceae bacterium]|nr:DUF6166 domain-containing protein [Solirubrobacteraceae bacterium]